jgi:hypothetical protein
MKIAKLILVFIMVAALLGWAACSDQGSTGGQGQKPMADRSPNMPSADDTPADKVEISGVLEQGEYGIVLVSDSGKYLVTGKDLTEMVGKTVTIKGTAQESAGQMKIEVDAVTATQ